MHLDVWRKRLRRLSSLPNRNKWTLSSTASSAFIAASVFLSFFIAFLTIVSVFTLDQVVIVGANSLPAGIDKLRGKNTLFLKETDVADWILEKNIDTASVHVEKELPASLIVTVFPRTPVAQVALNDYFYLVDNHGVVFMVSAEPMNLPLLTAYLSRIDVGNHFQAVWVDSVFTLLSYFRSWGVPIQVVELKNSEEIIFTTGETKIVSSIGEGIVKLSSLQTLIKAFRIEGSTPRVIDIRFDKPVVRF